MTADPEVITCMRDLGIKGFDGNEAMSDQAMIAWIRRRVYKGTTYGAFVEFQADRTILGSIIEGSDVEVYADPLFYPYPVSDFWTYLGWVEDEVRRLCVREA